MSHFSATFFLTSDTHFRGTVTSHPALYTEPDGSYAPGRIVFQMSSGLSLGEQVRIAERMAAAVGAWRDSIARQAEQERTAAEELAAARAEIARLKADREGGAA